MVAHTLSFFTLCTLSEKANDVALQVVGGSEGRIGLIIGASAPMRFE
jgi:hypothetical protein